jgi:hypothetical protein
MALYYFDMRDDDHFYPDEQGTELGGGLAAARIVALATLADYIQGRVPETDSPRRVAVEVTDGNHEPLMAAVLTVGFVPVARLRRRDKAIVHRAKPSLKFRHSGRSTTRSGPCHSEFPPECGRPDPDSVDSYPSRRRHPDGTLHFAKAVEIFRRAQLPSDPPHNERCGSFQNNACNLR